MCNATECIAYPLIYDERPIRYLCFSPLPFKLRATWDNLKYYEGKSIGLIYVFGCLKFRNEAITSKFYCKIRKDIK
ncbi:MAG TPA: hypothetical protein DET40_22995 [Lentisphaeria bacterium]|nr:MAG: hypothetical protein A2X45_15790 [Lentisphaerae bacterium GWF2_50_93]HCE46422.1 hypothetical protein [Lentisphaeria bacterium]